MLRQIPQAGWLILFADDPGAASLAEHAFSNVLSYGFSAAARFRSSGPILEDGGQRLAITLDGQPWGTARLPMAGRHNAANALAALAVGHVLGVKPKDLCDALASFGGVKRRLEVFLEARGAVFIDDFAHHPTAIAATIAAARSRWPARRIRALLEPRSNTLVTRQFDDAVFEALRDADEVRLAPIYRAERIPKEDQLDRVAIANRLKAVGVQAFVAEDFEEMAKCVWDSIGEGDLVLCMSNGAFGGMYQRFRELAGEGG
jgi:UDP-N-acetylmuramate: L-alanyl-gamma-D-glutamyl-meso-diaminopimelate ligase